MKERGAFPLKTKLFKVYDINNCSDKGKSHTIFHYFNKFLNYSLHFLANKNVKSTVLLKYFHAYLLDDVFS